MAVRKPAGEWIYEDLFDLPVDEGKRYEIIDGELFEWTARGIDHAMVVMNLIARLLPPVTLLGGCLLTAPADVYFGGANPVQPDLLVLLPTQFDLMRKRDVEGAPALLVEILSPANPKHDRVRQRALYARGGVPEYWLVSPEAATMEILVLDGDVYRVHLGADGDEPVTSFLLPDLSVPAPEAFAAPLAS